MEAERLEAGCDEAGRGCLAGPVFAAAVILDPTLEISGLDDSKKLSESRRNELRKEIEEKALAFAVAMADPSEIDKINILNASFLAMHRAVLALDRRPDHLLIDGNRFNSLQGYSHSTIIKGDGKFSSIAAASILAKTHRDAYMQQQHTQLPGYGFDRHKGYPTPQHIHAIHQLGFSDIHRRSFHLKQMQLSLL